jgi:MFS transporter, YNFM family, putative membrane transport protein
LQSFILEHRFATTRRIEISSAAVGDPITAATTRSGLRPYRQVFAPFLCGMFAFIDLYCTQPLLPLLALVFHASEARVSLTISASTLGVAFSALLLALFAERVNRKRMIVSCMVVLALCTLLTSTATSLAGLAVWRLLQGLVTPGIFIVTIAYVTEEWPALLVPRVMSVYVAGTVFGGFMGRLLGGLIAEHYSWRPVFLVLGIAGLGGAALTQRLLRPAQMHQASERSSSRLAPVVANLRNPRLLATFAIGFCMLFTLVACFSYITFYLAAPPFHLGTAQLSYLFTVYLCGLAATLAVGTILARVGLRVGMMAAIAACATGVVITLVPSLWIVALGLAITASGVFVAQTCANSFLRDAAPAGSRVSAAGMYIASYYIGGTAGGIVPGLVWTRGGWHACAALVLGILLIAAAAAVFGWRLRPPAPDPIPL